MATDARTERAMREQDYDGNPPRCLTCVYFRHEPQARLVERQVTTRKGQVKMKRFRIKAHPLKNPMVDRCTFGNFLVKRSGVCNEWHSRDGERIVEASDEAA